MSFAERIREENILVKDFVERESMKTDMAILIVALRTVDVKSLEQIEGFNKLITEVSKFGTPAESLPRILASIADMIEGAIT